jgi:predicted transcriptional regulator
MARRATLGYLASMLDRKPSAFDVNPDEERRADEEALRAYEAGRVVSHQAVREWLLSWGTSNERPRPKIGD